MGSTNYFQLSGSFAGLGESNHRGRGLATQPSRRKSFQLVMLFQGSCFYQGKGFKEGLNLRLVFKEFFQLKLQFHTRNIQNMQIFHQRPNPDISCLPSQSSQEQLLPGCCTPASVQGAHSTADHASRGPSGSELASVFVTLIMGTQQPAAGSFSVKSLQVTFKSHERPKTTLQAARLVMPIKTFFTATCDASSRALLLPCLGSSRSIYSPPHRPAPLHTHLGSGVLTGLGCISTTPPHISIGFLKDTDGSTQKPENATMKVAQALLIELL